MTGLVLELQADALNENISVLSLLRKAKVVSVKLEVTTINEWLDHELRGYPTRSSVPEYRRVVGRTVCHNPYRGWIPLEVRGADAQKFMTERRLHQSMGELCQFADKGIGESVLFMYPPQIAQQIMNGTDGRFEPALEVGVNVIHGVIATVRNKILDFALELEKQGILGEGLTFTQAEKMTASNITYNVNIENMTGSQLQQGTTSSTQTYNAQVTDLSAVAEFVERLLPAIGELSDATDREQVQSDLETIRSQLKAPKPKTGIIRECLTSVRSVLEGAAGDVGATYLAPLTALLVSIPS